MSLTLVVVITIKPAPKYVCTHIRTVCVYTHTHCISCLVQHFFSGQKEPPESPCILTR